MQTNIDLRPSLRPSGNGPESSDSLPRALADVILAIGQADFEKRLLTMVEKEFAARELLIVRSGRSGQVEELFRRGEVFLGERYADMSRTAVAGGLMRALVLGPRPNGRVVEAIPSLQRWSSHGDNIAEVGAVSGCGIVSRTSEQVLCLELRRRRADGPLNTGQVRKLHATCAVIAAAVERHYASAVVPRASCSLASMVDAFVRLTIGASPLSKREAETCGRIVLGYSIEAIALDLRISKHSAATYRRRAFAKLNIATSKELFGIVLRYGGQPGQSPASK